MSDDDAAARVDAEELRVAALVLQDHVVDLKVREKDAKAEEETLESSQTTGAGPHLAVQTGVQVRGQHLGHRRADLCPFRHRGFVGGRQEERNVVVHI